MEKQIRLKDKVFELYIPEKEIVRAIERMEPTCSWPS